jgi:hypothetical protein
MKYILFLLSITMFVIFAGCSKSKKGTSNPTGSMSATINGVAVNFSHCPIGSISGGGLYINGFEDSVGVGRSIQLSITNYTTGATGTYTITTYPNVTVSASVDSNTAGQDALSGTITIKAASASAISGTFSFTTYGTTVTNGVFNAVQ